ncbi:hypothetical protein [Desulfobacter latus]|uniref:Uncharacterized protein n=1 Tax=Desulfobacter latus TaxID=2292 RepID=A0A850SW34_9BACT|nr:hypothetical protein [Desulfobacter latus]NWH05359.1 hypothetical protein [Desulfobacter latus]
MSNKGFGETYLPNALGRFTRDCFSAADKAFPFRLNPIFSATVSQGKSASSWNTTQRSGPGPVMLFP